MKKTNIILTAIFILAAAALLPSCSKQKKPASAENPPATAEKGAPAGAEAAAPAVAVKKRTPAELLAAIPCKLNGKKGLFAVFPDNPAAGQICFSLAPPAGNGASVTTFDIQGGSMHIINHDTNNAPAAALKIVKLENRGGKPCVEKSCVSEIAASNENYTDPAETGWRYTILTPSESPNLSSGAGAYFGVAAKSGPADMVYAPVFE